MLFRRNLFITLFLFVFSFASFAQNTSYLDSLKGKYALQFQISDNFNLTNFQGTTFSGKYHLSSKSVVRVGLSFSLSNADGESKETRPNTASNNNNANSDQYSLTILSQYIRYIRGIDDIVFFIGGGPFVGFDHSTLEADNTSSNSVFHSNDDVNGFSTGLDLLAGVEWIFTKNMSLSAEYGIMFSYYSSTRNYTDDNSKIKTTNKRISIGRGDVNFGISVYF